MVIKRIGSQRIGIQKEVKGCKAAGTSKEK
jgi:hypothetical protein